MEALKRTVVRIIGREAANRLSSPYHDWMARRRTRTALRHMPRSHLCVNLGCGTRSLAGWINLDRARGPQVDVVWDFTRGLPFPSRSCSALFAEHAIEHVSKLDAQHLLQECFRVLQPEGVLRISTPDGERYLRSYAGDGSFLHNRGFAVSAESPMDRINMMMREGGQHLWIYDSTSLGLALRRAGFLRIQLQSFGLSLHPAMTGIDSEARAFESFYVEAVR